MKILADENIPLVEEAFGALGEIRLMPGREMTADDVKDCEILLVRSVTRVDEALLKNSAVKFVGSATIGIDHLDTAYLEANAIQWSSAPGSNADSVADYVVAALLHLSAFNEQALEELRLGVIGCGNVGSRVAKRAKALGMEVIENDPPLARSTGDPRYRPLRDLYKCDVLTIHTPLTMDGPDPTYHLIDEKVLHNLYEDTVIINTARSGVIDTPALKASLLEGWVQTILDVWDNEPSIDRELLDYSMIGTPHIAGYSIDGKIRGTWQIYQAVCGYLGISPTVDYESLLSTVVMPESYDVHTHSFLDEEVLDEAVEYVYSIMSDDMGLRWLLKLKDPKNFPVEFDKLRKNYRKRREFSSTTIRLIHATQRQKEKLEGIGFNVIAD